MKDVGVRLKIGSEGLENISALTRELDKAGVSTDEFDAKAQALNAEFQRLSREQALIDQFVRTKKAVGEAATAMELAQIKAQALAREIAATEAPTKAQAAAFDKARAAVTATDQAYQAQRLELQQLRAQLGSAGISTDELAAAQVRVRSQLDSARKGVTDLTRELQQLGDEQRGVEQLTQLAQASEKARGALQSADTALESYRRELTSTEEPTRAQAAQLVKLTEAVRQAQVAFLSQSDAQARAAAALRAAGVDTERLATAQAVARGELTATAAASQKLAEAYRAQAAAVSGAFSDVGVRSLQTIRAETLKVDSALTLLKGELAAGRIGADDFGRAVAAAALKLHALHAEAASMPAVPGALAEVNTAITGVISKFGAITGAVAAIGFAARPLFELAVQTDTLRRSLTTVAGSAEAAEKQIEFLRSTAQKAGVSVGDISSAYLRFAASASSAGISTEVVNKVFASTANAAGNLGLSSEKVTLILDALGQMAGKGVVSMEELRQQLGDSLPGAVSLLAKGLGLTQAELINLVESGQLLSRDALPALAEAMTTLGAKGEQVEGLSASFNRFKNIVYEAGQQLNDGAIGQGAGALLSVVGGVLRDITVIAVGFNQALAVSGKVIALVAAAATGNISSFKQFKEEFAAIFDESAKKMSDFEDHAYASGTAAKQAGADAAAAGKDVDAGAQAYAKAGAAAETVAQMHGAAAASATASGTAHTGLGTATTAAAGAATNASVSWAKLTSDYIGLTTEMARQVKVAEKVVEAKKLEGDAAVAISKISGDSAEILRAEALAAANNATAQRALAATRKTELDVLQAQLAAETALSKQLGDPDGTREKQIQAIKKTIEAKTAETDAEKAAAEAATTEASARAIAIQTAKDNSGALVELKRAYEAARDQLALTTQEEKKGLATKGDVQAATRRLAEAEALYHDALDDTASALARRAERQKQAADITLATLNLQKAQLESQLALAKLDGNDALALDARIKLKQLEVKIIEAKIAATKLEALATIAKAEADKAALEAEGKLTDAARLSIDASIAGAKVKLLEAAAQQESVKVMLRQIENLRLYGDEAGKARDKSRNAIDKETRALEENTRATDIHRTTLVKLGGSIDDATAGTVKLDSAAQSARTSALDLADGFGKVGDRMETVGDDYRVLIGRSSEWGSAGRTTNESMNTGFKQIGDTVGQVSSVFSALDTITKTWAADTIAGTNAALDSVNALAAGIDNLAERQATAARNAKVKSKLGTNQYAKDANGNDTIALDDFGQPINLGVQATDHPGMTFDKHSYDLAVEAAWKSGSQNIIDPNRFWRPTEPTYTVPAEGGMGVAPGTPAPVITVPYPSPKPASAPSAAKTPTAAPAPANTTHTINVQMNKAPIGSFEITSTTDPKVIEDIFLRIAQAKSASSYP